MPLQNCAIRTHVQVVITLLSALIPVLIVILQFLSEIQHNLHSRETFYFVLLITQF